VEKDLDVVLFELPTAEIGRRLASRLRPQWPTWLLQCDPLASVVSVDLSGDPQDLARLLRIAMHWVSDVGLPKILVNIDGREYGLPPRKRNTTT
jgi:hypothetical protein